MKKAITEFRGLDSRELQAKLAELRKEQFGLRFKGGGGDTSSPARPKQLRRTIARIMSVLGERSRGSKA